MESTRRRWQLQDTLCVAVVLCAGLSPLAADEFWWDLSRGRTVVNGSLAPSRVLLANELGSEADWLGGVPAYAIFELSGINGLAITKVVLTGGLLWLLLKPTTACCLRHGRREASSTQDNAPCNRTAASCVAGLGVLAAVDGLDSISRSIDLLCVASVAAIASSFHATGRRRDALLLSTLLAIWTNTGRLSVAGLLALVPRTWTRRELLPVGIAVVLLCLTPRGVLTLWDSLRLFVPRLAETTATLSQTGFRATVTSPWDVQVATFAVVCAITVSLLWCHEKSLPRCVTAFLVIGIGWSARSSVAACSILLTVQSLECLRLVSTAAGEASTDSARITRPQITGLAALLAACVGTAGPFKTECTLGFGLSPRLDIRLLQSSLRNSPVEGTACCVDSRSAGMLGWAVGGDSPRLQPDDTDARALLGGRLRDRMLIKHDLETGLRNPQRREDGSLAGWWVSLQQRQTALLLVPAENTRMIRALEPTWWKPLSLDSPVLPFGRAGDPNCAQRLILVLQEREFVDQGDWSYSPAADLDSRQHVDLWQVLIGHGRWNLTLRQARVFHAMHLHNAATRVIQPAVSAGNAVAEDIHAACEAELRWTQRLTGSE